jgi:hypothetical protein
MPNYLKNENNLILWPVLKEVTENDLFQGNIGLRARYDMTMEELLTACLEAWKVNREGSYRLLVNRAEGGIELPLEGTVKEAGLRNGDFLEIIAA